MKKLFFILIGIALCALPLSAQKKPTPREILDKTSHVLESNEGFSAKFTTTSFQGTTPVESLSGTLDVCGNKYLMKTDAVCTWYNGKDQWTLLSDNNEVSLVSPTPEELQASSPMAFINVYRNGFNLSAKPDILRGKKIWNVTLKPQKRKQEPSSIVVSIDQETFLPLCLRIRNDGNWFRISITDTNTNIKFADSHFTFPASDYPEYDVIDMR